MSNQTPNEDNDVTTDSGRSHIRTVRVGNTGVRKAFEAQIRGGYSYGDGKTVQEGPCTVLIPIAPDTKTGHPGLVGYLHMLNNAREAREVLGLESPTFLSLRAEATDGARIGRRASGPAGAQPPVDIAAIVNAAVQSTIASVVPATVAAVIAALDERDAKAAPKKTPRT